MTGPDKDQRATFEMDPRHAITAFWVTWEALGMALAHIARQHPDAGWKADMRKKMLDLFETGEFEETESGEGFTHRHLAPHAMNFEPEAVQTGIRAVDAALARISYR